MQVYTTGINPIFWKEVEAQPEGVYNRENFQTTSAQITQLLVAFVGRPVGNVVDIYKDGVKISSAVVADPAGFIYTDITLPYTKNQDAISLTIRDPNGGITIASETVSTSHIAFFFEVQADLYDDRSVSATELGQSNSIIGVSDDLLEPKFGSMTGVLRRIDQNTGEYRNQTACLWQAYTFSGTERGLTDVLQCILGQGVTITISATRDDIGNRIFTLPQFGSSNADIYLSGVPPLVRTDIDAPHFYVADIPSDYRISYPATESPIDVLLLGIPSARPEVPTINPEGWTTPDLVESFTLHTLEAKGNELIVEIEESDAIRSIIGESVIKEFETPFVMPPDQLSIDHIASTVTVTQATIGGVVQTLSANLPQENTDFTVDVLTGKITWVFPATPKKPDQGTTYVVNYDYRLDTPITIVVKRVKPAHKSVVIVFNNQVSQLPPAIEI